MGCDTCGRIKGHIRPENFMEENIMNDFKPPKFIKFPSDLRGIRYKNGKEEVKILCSDGEYHWIDYSRYKNR